jgi:hypothetical protein
MDKERTTTIPLIQQVVNDVDRKGYENKRKEGINDFVNLFVLPGPAHIIHFPLFSRAIQFYFSRSLSPASCSLPSLLF